MKVGIQNPQSNGKKCRRSTTPIVRKLMFGVAYGLVGHMSLRGAQRRGNPVFGNLELECGAPRGRFIPAQGGALGYARTDNHFPKALKGRPIR